MSDDHVHYAPGDDAALHAASKLARETFKYFWRELTWEYRRIVPALEMSAIKCAFRDEGGAEDEVEHMWVGDVSFDGQTVRGTLLNDPNKLRTHHAGDLVTIPFAQLEDWIYAREGRAYGAFTVHILRAGMSPAERRAHDGAWGYDFGPPETPAVVPDWNAAKQPGFFGKLMGKASLPATAPDDEHPMSENMADSLSDAIAEQGAALVTGVDENGLNLLHHMALGGSAACVRVLLDAGADRSVRTEAGLTARDLAERVGWPHVVGLIDGVR